MSDIVEQLRSKNRVTVFRVAQKAADEIGLLRDQLAIAERALTKIQDDGNVHANSVATEALAAMRQRKDGK